MRFTGTYTFTFAYSKRLKLFEIILYCTAFCSNFYKISQSNSSKTISNIFIFISSLILSSLILSLFLSLSSLLLSSSRHNYTVLHVAIKKGNTNGISDVVAALKSATSSGEWHPYIYLFPYAINIIDVSPLGMSIFWLSKFFFSSKTQTLSLKKMQFIIKLAKLYCLIKMTLLYQVIMYLAKSNIKSTREAKNTEALMEVVLESFILFNFIDEFCHISNVY